jgi:hypothetical protein
MALDGSTKVPRRPARVAPVPRRLGAIVVLTFSQDASTAPVLERVRAAQVFPILSQAALRLTLDSPSVLRIELDRFQEVVVLDVAAGKYVSLNEVGAFIWERLVAGKTPASVVLDVVASYNVDETEARRDIQKLAQQLLDAGLLERRE